MKKAISLILVLALCMPLAACGSGGEDLSKYVGTYIGDSGQMHDDIKLPSGYSATSSGTKTLVLNRGGTGTVSYVGQFDYSSEEPFTMYSYDIKWEVIDGYLYVTGTGNYLIGSGVESKTNDQYELQGKTLVDVLNPQSRFGRLTKQ